MSISVQNLIKKYGSLTVVHGVSFDVAKGEFLSLLGPSGCGKTTSLRCIAGLEESNGGVIKIDDKIVSAPEQDIMTPPHERQIGMVFQSYAIWPHMTVGQNVGFPLSIRKMPKAQVEKEVDEALEIVGLRALKDRHPSQLSGGQQQRVALARAIVGKPKVLLFDEPLSNLDAKLRESTRSEIRRLQRELNVAAVYVTHDQEEALSMSDRVIVMNHGRIMQEGTPRDLYRKPSNRFVGDFVGRASFIDVTRQGDIWSTQDGTALKVAGVKDAEAIGGRHQAMLRPEVVDLVEATSASGVSGEDINLLPGKIGEGHYLGAYNEYLVQAAGTTIKVHSVADLAPGADVMLRFNRLDTRLVAVPE
jgi:ABC-type Fe3+/spermidine/putrescine transport system ATPase subunit